MSYSIDPAKGHLSTLVYDLNLSTLLELRTYLTNLSYRRISDPNRLSLIVMEGCGTCSSKHAFLKALADEQQWENVYLILCIFKMNATNTPGIGKGIEDNNLPYIPEAHCYVRINQEAVDVTKPGAGFAKIEQDILSEYVIQIDQIGEWKKNFHRNYIDQWRSSEKISKSLEDLWVIREACILSLSSS